MQTIDTVYGAVVRENGFSHLIRFLLPHRSNPLYDEDPQQQCREMKRAFQILKDDPSVMIYTDDPRAIPIAMTGRVDFFEAELIARRGDRALTPPPPAYLFAFMPRNSDRYIWYTFEKDDDMGPHLLDDALKKEKQRTLKADEISTTPTAPEPLSRVHVASRLERALPASLADALHGLGTFVGVVAIVWSVARLVGKAA